MHSFRAFCCCALTLFAPLAATALPPTLHEIASFDAPGNAVQLEYSSKYDLLFLRNSFSAVHVVDTKTEQEIGLELANYQFTDFDLTPDTHYLYAADYGGTNIGYGTPYRTSYIHRYDLDTRTWETKAAPAIAYRIEGVSSDRYLLQEIDQWIDITLNSWGSPNQELARISANYSGDFEYDSRTGRIYHGNSGSSSAEIQVTRLIGDTLTYAGGTGTYGTAQGGGGTSVLSSDGLRFYFGRLQVEALDVTNNIRYFPETIYAATPTIAFGKNGYYDAKTGALLGTLGFDTIVYSVSDDGRDVWAFNPDDDTLHHYAIPELNSFVISSFVMFASAGTMLMRRRNA